MAGPWEKYAKQKAQSAPAAGPWTKYAKQAEAGPAPDFDALGSQLAAAAPQSRALPTPSITPSGRVDWRNDGQTGLREQSMSGVNEGIAGLLGLPVDLVTGGINGIAGGINHLTGSEIPVIWGALTAYFGWVFRHIFKTKQSQDSLHRALHTGVDLVTDVLVRMLLTNPAGMAVDRLAGEVVDYVRGSVPGALRWLLPSEDQLLTMARAKLQERTAELIAKMGPDRLAQALRRAGAPAVDAGTGPTRKGGTAAPG